MTKQELIDKGYESVGFVAEDCEWMVKKTQDEEYLYHVLKNGQTIYQYPKSVDADMIKGIQLIKESYL